MHKSKRMRVSTFSSSNENHNSHLLSLLSPKPLSIMFFPTSAPTPPNPIILLAMQWFFLNGPFPLQSLTLAIQCTQPKFPQPDLSLRKSKAACCSLFARTLRLQEKSSPNVPVQTWMWQQRQQSGWGKTPVHSVAPLICSMQKGEKLLCKSQSQSIINGWEFCKHWQISTWIPRYIPDVRPPSCQILNPCHSVGDAKFSEKRPTELFNTAIYFPTIPLGNGWVWLDFFPFLTFLHINVKHSRQVRKFWHGYEGCLHQLL